METQLKIAKMQDEKNLSTKKGLELNDHKELAKENIMLKALMRKNKDVHGKTIIHTNHLIRMYV